LVADLVGEPETLIVDSTLLWVLQPRQVPQSAGLEGAAWVRWGSLALHGVKLLHLLLCATNRLPVSYDELTPANTPEVLLREELLDGADLAGETARRLFADLVYRSEDLGKALAERGVLLATERAERRPATRQQVEVCFAVLKRVLVMEGTLAKPLVGLATRIVAKVTAYTYGCYVNRFVGRPQGRIKELWA
jgi:hypothetical protein